MITDLHVHVSGSIEQYVDTRAEFDQPYALAALQAISDFRMEHDAARQQSGDLLEDYRLAVGISFALYGDDVLFILIGRGLIHGVEVLPALVADLANHARDGRAVHVDIKHVQENTDPSLPLTADCNGRDIGDFAIAG